VIANQTGPADYSSPENSIAVEPHQVEEGLRKMIGSLHQFDAAEVRKTIEDKYGVTHWSKIMEKTLRLFLK
jgi:hypothetical protein